MSEFLRMLSIPGFLFSVIARNLTVHIPTAVPVTPGRYEAALLYPCPCKSIPSLDFSSGSEAYGNERALQNHWLQWSESQSDLVRLVNYRIPPSTESDRWQNKTWFSP